MLESVGAQTSGFETSDADVNRLYENIVWGQRGNFLSIPTDCPQRDERLGWTGDAQVFSRSATYNMNVDPFFTRWFQSIRDIQGDDGSYPNIIPNIAAPPRGANPGGGAMGWMEAGIIIPWQLYLQYADAKFLRDHYDSMVAYMGFLQKRAVGGHPAGRRLWRLGGARAYQFAAHQHGLLRLRCAPDGESGDGPGQIRRCGQVERPL